MALDDDQDAELDDLDSEPAGGEESGDGSPASQDAQAAVDGSFDGGRGGSAPPAAPAPAAPAPPAQAGAPHALQPLLQHLPPGLRRAIASGSMTPEDAVNRHYGNRRWSDLIATEQQARQLDERNKQILGRFEALAKHLTDTLGLELPKELQPTAAPEPPSEVAQLAGKVDEFMRTVEDQRLDGMVDQVESYGLSDREAVIQQEPEFADAESFVVNQIIDQQRQEASRLLDNWNLTKDPRILERFNPEYLQRVAAGEMTGEELVELSALDRCFDLSAHLQQRHFHQRTSMAGDFLQLARKWGWKPTREGGTPQPAEPTNGGPAARPAPGPARRDPNLDLVRRGITHTPAPARNGAPALDHREVVARVSSMSEFEFEKMLSESDNPARLMDQLLKMVAVH